MMLFQVKRIREIDPDEIFLDATNLPEHDSAQFEGRVVQPISRLAIWSIGAFFSVIVLFFGMHLYALQITGGENYADVSRTNTFEQTLMFAARGRIYDDKGVELAWNEAATSTTATSTATSTPIATRKYITDPGMAHLLGFVRYPKKDAQGAWQNTDYAGISGLELAYNSLLSGTNGEQIVEATARGKVLRQNIEEQPVDGADIHLSIDSEIESKLYTLLNDHSVQYGFEGGAAAIMDVTNGHLIALTSFPEYDNNAFANGEGTIVAKESNDPRLPLLNRAIGGVYTPGSIVKPIFALAALHENVISPEKQIDSVGQIEVQNPYDKTKKTIFKDWTVHGWINMREAIAESSDEYFYTIGGGYKDQAGLGIARIDKYAQMFGLGTTTGIALLGEQGGIVPTPQWKAQAFDTTEGWLLGDTYHTVIGQFGFQITPLQAVRYAAAIANRGKLFTPELLASSTPQFTQLPFTKDEFDVIHDGMRMAVNSGRAHATVVSLNMDGIDIAGKSGTAQLGTHNQWMNAWVIGYWPADHPRYAFAAVLEHAKAGTLQGAAPAMRPFFEWLIANRSDLVHPTSTAATNIKISTSTDSTTSANSIHDDVPIITPAEGQ